MNFEKAIIFKVRTIKLKKNPLKPVEMPIFLKIGPFWKLQSVAFSKPPFFADILIFWQFQGNFCKKTVIAFGYVD